MVSFNLSNWQRLSSFFMIALLLWCTSGCSVFRSSTESFSVVVSPQDSIILVNGQSVHSSAVIQVPRDRNVNIQCMKNGYYPYANTIGTRLSTTGVLDVLGLCLILLPGIGLLTAGAWTLDQGNLSVTLVPITK